MSEFFIKREDLIDANCAAINAVFFEPEGKPSNLASIRFSLLMEQLGKNGVTPDSTERMLHMAGMKCKEGVRLNTQSGELWYD